MNLRFEFNPESAPASSDILQLYQAAGILLQSWTVERMDRAMKKTSFFVCVWHEKELVGFARGISDFAWTAWLSQLAIDPKFQNQGIGKKMVELIVKQLGEEVTLLTHAADKATGFYEAMKFELYPNIYRRQRSK